jgi:hypothetical protein
MPSALRSRVVALDPALSPFDAGGVITPVEPCGEYGWRDCVGRAANPLFSFGYQNNTNSDFRGKKISLAIFWTKRGVTRLRV